MVAQDEGMNELPERVRRLLEDNPVGERSLKVNRQLKNDYFREYLAEEMSVVSLRLISLST